MSFIISKNEPEFINANINGIDHKVFAGSFFMAPKGDDYFKVNLMAEYGHLTSNLHIPIKDFGVPSSVEEFRVILDGIKNRVANHEKIYVGCFAGIGRTGLFLACFFKLLGYKNPLEYVREHYNPKAVESEMQKDFLSIF